MEILKIRSSILHTFELISRTFHFLDDLDLVDDLDLWLRVTQKNHVALSFDISLRLPLYDNPDTVYVCVPASNYPNVSEN